MPPEASGLRTIYLLAKREFTTRVRSRFFLGGTAVLIVITVGFIVLQANVFSRSGSAVTIAFYGPAQALAQPLVAAARPQGLRVTTKSAASLSSGEAAVRDGSLDALVYGDPAAPAVAVKDTLNPQVAGTLSDLVRQQALNRALAERGVSPAEITAAVDSANVRVQTLDPGAAQRTERTVAGSIVTILLYVTILMYGQILAAGVVEEKANRIVEVLLPAIRPRALLFGKVIGIGLVGILQLVLLGGSGLIAVTQTHVFSLPTLGITVVASGLLWFVLGFMLYALLYGGVASLVSRQEEVGAATSPLTILVVGTYFAFFWVIANPDNHVAIALSMLPPFAPILMPSRMATGDATWWQVVVALALIVPTILAVNAAGARIYTNSVMRTGVRVSLREAWTGRS